MIGIPSKDISKFWATIENAILTADAKAEFLLKYPLDYIKSQLERADWQCFIKDETVFLTCVTDYPSGIKSLEVLLVAGEDMQIWSKEAWSTFKRWAKELGCYEIDFQGRKGWLKYGRRYEPSLKTWHRYRVEI